MSVWYDIIKPAIEEHAPVQQKRIKNDKTMSMTNPRMTRNDKKRSNSSVIDYSMNM